MSDRIHDKAKLFVSVERRTLHEEKPVHKKTWDRSPSYINVWWKLFNDWQQLQHGTRGYQINIYMYIFTGSIGEGLCVTDSFVPLVSLYSCCYIQWHPMHIGLKCNNSGNYINRAILLHSKGKHFSRTTY